MIVSPPEAGTSAFSARVLYGIVYPNIDAKGGEYEEIVAKVSYVGQCADAAAIQAETCSPEVTLTIEFGEEEDDGSFLWIMSAIIGLVAIGAAAFFFLF